ncbi:MAG: hypothetical protein ACQEXJ_22835 [Myxococcota bacterium]
MDAAMEASLQAAVKALRAGSPRDAVEALEPALERATVERLEEAEMLVRGLLAPALAQLGDVSRAEPHARRAHELAVARGDEESAAHYGGLADQLDQALHPEEDPNRPLTEQEMEAALDRAGDALTRAHPEEAVTLLEALAESTEASGHAAVEASARGMLAQALIMMRRGEEARPHLERAAAIAGRMNEPRAEAHFRELLGDLEPGSRRDALSKVDLARVREEANEARSRAGEEMEAERFAEAVAILEPAAEHARREGASAAEASVRSMLAQALVMSGRREDAAREAERGLELARGEGDEEAVESFTQLLALATGWKSSVGDA